MGPRARIQDAFAIGTVFAAALVRSRPTVHMGKCHILSGFH